MWGTRVLRSLLAALFGKPKPVTGPSEAAAGAPQLSVIICSIDEARYANVSANLQRHLGGISHELIRIRDAGSLAEGYNRGMDLSRGGLLIFCHDDIEVLQPDFLRRLLGHLDHFDMVGVAGTTRLKDSHWGSAGVPATHGQVLQPLEQGEGYVLNVFCQDGHAEAAAGGIQALDGLFIAARRPAAQAVRFDERTFDGFHLYDLDFSFRAHLAGYRVGVCHDILIYHQSNGRKDAVWQRYGVRFEDKFAGQLSREPAGPPLVYQVRVQDKAQGLAAFERVLSRELVFR
jgi:cellulose synthase/poly-beta-1,6-N-acetylglucosamine synthase-like glycosyltransferase